MTTISRHVHDANNQFVLTFEDWYLSDVTAEEVGDDNWHVHPELYFDELMSIILNRFFIKVESVPLHRLSRAEGWGR